MASDNHQEQGRLLDPVSLLVLAALAPKEIAMIVVGILLPPWLGLLIAKGVRRWRIRRESEDLREACRQAYASYENVREGLKTMAQLVPQLERSRLALSARGVELLDRHAVSMMDLRRAARASYGPSRSRRVAKRKLQDLAGLDRALERFQHAVLVTLYQQALARVVMPPVVRRRYRVAFTVLKHDLPSVLWPVMNKILAQHVELWVQDVAGVWRMVRGIGIRLGREIVFSRRHLEQARELRLVVRRPDGRTFASEFVVEHERPLKPLRSWTRWFNWLGPRQPRSHPMPL